MHVVTLDPDGTPRVTLSWAGFESDDIVMATFFHLSQPKLVNLRRHPRIVLSFAAREHAAGLHPHAVIQGRARITQGGALDVMDRLAEHSLGPERPYPMWNVPDVVRLTVERIDGQGPWGEGS